MEHIELALRSPFLKGLSPEESKAVLETGRKLSLPANSYLFHQDDPATLCYILLTGTVRLSQVTVEGHQIIVHHVTPGEGFGVIVVLSQIPYPVSAEAVEDVTVLAWNEETMISQMYRYPQLAINGMEMLAQHFVQVQERFRELATERVERRVAHALLRLVRQVGRRTESGILIDLPLSRQDLAEMTGTTLFTTSRILSQWERQGWISTGREEITLVQPHKIVMVAEDLPSVPGHDLAEGTS